MCVHKLRTQEEEASSRCLSDSTHVFIVFFLLSPRKLKDIVFSTSLCCDRMSYSL